MFLLNWPYVWAAMAPDADNVPFRDKDVGFTTYPETVAGRPSKPPFGGIEIGVGKYGSHKDLAWEAVKCITSPEHQTEYMVNSGQPVRDHDVLHRSRRAQGLPGRHRRDDPEVPAASGPAPAVAVLRRPVDRAAEVVQPAAVGRLQHAGEGGRSSSPGAEGREAAVTGRLTHREREAGRDGSEMTATAEPTTAAHARPARKAQLSDRTRQERNLGWSSPRRRSS